MSPFTSFAVDRTGNFYVSDIGAVQEHDTVRECASNGRLLHKWGGRRIAPGSFSARGDLTFDQEGNLYVVDEGNHRLQELPTQAPRSDESRGALRYVNNAASLIHWSRG